MNFNAKKSLIFKLAKARLSPLVKLAINFNKVFLWLSLILIVVFIVGSIEDLFVFGLFLISISIFLILWQIKIFFLKKATNLLPDKSIDLAISNNLNLADYFDLDSAISIISAIRDNKNRLNADLLAWHLLLNNPDFNFIFTRMGVSFNEVKKFVKQRCLEERRKRGKLSRDFHQIINSTLQEASKDAKKRASVEDLLLVLSRESSALKEIFFQRDIKEDDLRNLAYWLDSIKRKVRKSRKFWHWSNLIKRGSLAKDWIFGYTTNLDRFSIDWTARFRKSGFPDVIGHKEEIKKMERILSRREEVNNVLLVGERGTGRKTIIYDLAKKSFCEESLPEINNKRVVELDLSSVLAQTDSNEEVEGLLDIIFDEATRAGNVILVIKDFSNFVGVNSGPGQLNISGVLAKYLYLSQFQVIAITNQDGFKKEIERNSSIIPFFDKVEVTEISQQETLMLLYRMALVLERKYNKIVSYLALKNIVSCCERYMPSLPFPKKAMELLEEAVIYINQNNKEILLSEDIDEVVSQKVNVPVGDIKGEEKERLVNLEKDIHERVVSQEEAVYEIASALRRSRSELSERKRPMGNFLFLGPTGVGKTETAKALAASYFGSEDKMIRIDMSEFQSLNDIPRLIGSHSNEGLLTSKINNNPFSLILLDEIEKAHPDILNIFLQILDEGNVTDGFQRKVDFKNSIIIATSNAGAHLIMESVSKKKDWQKTKEDLLDNLFKENIFRPEFVNRFDAVVLFKPLTKDDLMKISDLIFKKIIIGMDKKGIDLVISKELKENIIEIAYNPKFGARELKRVIQDKVENSLASALLSDEIGKGDIIKINPETFSVEKD